MGRQGWNVRRECPSNSGVNTIAATVTSDMGGGKAGIHSQASTVVHSHPQSAAHTRKRCQSAGAGAAASGACSV